MTIVKIYMNFIELSKRDLNGGRSPRVMVNADLITHMEATAYSSTRIHFLHGHDVEVTQSVDTILEMSKKKEQ